MAAGEDSRSINFLDLPAELRLNIYELAFADTLKEPEDAWTRFPPHSRFSTFWSFALTASQVSEEVTSLFEKKYTDLVQFYFDDVCNLQDFQQYASNQKALKDARFTFRAYPQYPIDEQHHYFMSCYDSPDYDGPRYMRSDASWDFICFGTGVRDQWPKYCKARESANWAIDSDGDLFAKKITRLGFKLIPDMHSPVKMNFDSNHTLIFPPLPGGLTLKMHRRDGCLTTMELSGRLRDVTFDHVDLDRLRARLYFARDSPWIVSRWNSPDLDSEERREMDEDSWGVPDEESENEDVFETTWQSARGAWDDEENFETIEA